jgi:SHS2 domain-containing protein
MDFSESDVILLDHTADLGIMVRGVDIKNIFERTAHAMMNIMVSRKSAGKSHNLNLSLDAEDSAELMVHWLGEILYLFHGEKKVVTRLEINSISLSHLDATLEAVPFDTDYHEVLREIKAVTFHQIEVGEKDDQWEAKIFFDL